MQCLFDLIGTINLWQLQHVHPENVLDDEGPRRLVEEQQQVVGAASVDLKHDLYEI